MRPSRKKALLWHGASVLLYLGGMALFLVVAVSVFLAPPSNSFANLSTGDTVLVLVSVVFLVGGRYVGWRYGLGEQTLGDSVAALRDHEPEPSKLEQLGYRVSHDTPGETEQDTAYEDGSVYRVCPDCGANNDSEYRFCRECSAELSE